MSFDFDKSYPTLAAKRQFQTVEGLKNYVKKGCILHVINSYCSQPHMLVEYHILTNPVEVTSGSQILYSVNAVIYYDFEGTVEKIRREDVYLSDLIYGCKAVFTEKARAEEWLSLVKQAYATDDAWQKESFSLQNRLITSADW